MKQTFRALNGLRFFAAFAVVCYHYAPMTKGFGALPLFLQNLAHTGPVALGFFYILSGFVLAHAYSDRPPQTPSQRGSFWFARVARLYPVYFLAFVLFLPMAWEKYLQHPAPGTNGPQTFALGAVLSVLAIQAWTPLSQAWNGPSWSLSVEAFFYFLFPFLLVPLARMRWSRLLPLLILCWGAMLATDWAHLAGMIPEAVWRSWLQNQPLLWTPLFLIGIALYRCYGYWRSVTPGVAALVGIAALCLLIGLSGIVTGPATELFITGGAAPIMALIVLAFAHPESPASRAMGTPALYEAGAASYVMYILQSPVWHVFRTVTDKLRHAAKGQPVAVWQFFAYAVTLLAFSILVQFVLERPAQRWLLSWRSSRQKSTPEIRLGTPTIEAP